MGHRFYKGFEITKGGPMGWEYIHPDYDGAPMETGGPPADNRCGYAKTIQDCMDEIDDLIESEEE